MKRLDPGQLRLTATIESRSSSWGTDGVVSHSWSTAATRRVFLRPLVGREFVEGQAINARMSHKVRMRFYTGLSSLNHRLKIGSRVFEIVSVANVDEYGDEHELLCAEVLT